MASSTDCVEVVGKKMTRRAGVNRTTAARLSVIRLPDDFLGRKAQRRIVRKTPIITGEREWCRGTESNCRHHDFQFQRDPSVDCRPVVFH